MLHAESSHTGKKYEPVEYSGEKFTPVEYPGGFISYHEQTQVVVIEGNGLPEEDIYLGEDRNNHPFIQIFRVIKRARSSFEKLDVIMYRPTYQSLGDGTSAALQLRVSQDCNGSADFLNFIYHFLFGIQKYLLYRGSISFNEQKYFENISELTAAARGF